MTHRPVHMGGGWRCDRCGVCWDIDEPEPEECCEIQSIPIAANWQPPSPLIALRQRAADLVEEIDALIARAG